MVLHYANDYPVIYTNPDKEFVIRITDEGEKKTKTSILCNKLKDSKPQALSQHAYQLLQITDNACQRDGTSLLESAQVILNEMSTITNLDKAKPPQVE